MGRLWVSLALLAGLFGGALANGWYLDRLTDGMAQTLEQAQAEAEAGNWAAGRQLTGQARRTWEKASGYLHIVLRHSETDEVSALFREVEQLLQWQEAAEYASSNARLVEEIRLLADMERLNLKNIL